MTLRDKMLAVIADTNASVAEREELVEMIAIALLTRKNLFVLGEPGQAKSYAINLFRRHITGARQFERLLSKQSDEEQLFGRVDLASLLPGSVPQTVLEQDATYQNQRFNLRVLVEGIGSMKDEPATWEKLKSGTEKLELYRAALSALHKSEPAVQTAGKIPEADIVLLDEIFKCNDGVLNSLLTALNERKYTNEGRTYPIPVISFFAASNEIPNFNDPQEKILEALYVASGIGAVIAYKACIAGASGGCQAEIGTASAMAAGALVALRDGTGQQIGHAVAMALKNLMGLVCDPVAGLVEVPCVKRNVIGAVNAISAADMALAGIESRIPVDEVIDAMGEVGRRMPVEFRETALGGLAATPTGRRVKQQMHPESQEF